MSEEKKEEFEHSGRKYPLGALNPKDNPKLKKQEKEEVMKKMFVACLTFVAAVVVVALMLSQQEKQISTLQEELKEVKESISSLRSQTVALDKKVFEDLSCLVAGGKISHNGYGEKSCDIDKKDVNFYDWVEIEKMEKSGWTLVSINASGIDAKKEGKIFFNLVKEHEIGMEKIKEVEIFYDSPKWPLRLGLWFKKN